MDEATRICATLLTLGAVSRTEVRELEHPAIRADVEERLRRCGLALATSSYGEHVGLRLDTKTSDTTVLDASSNLGLGKDACALLTVLWARLALQRRTAQDSRVTPETEPALISEERTAAAREYAPVVRFETLAREFGAQLGGRTRLKALLGRLRRLDFVSYHRLDEIAAGPLLELAIDGERMVSFIRSRVLSEIIQPHETPSVEEPPSSELWDEVFRAIAEHDGPIAITELEKKTGMRRARVRAALKDLQGAGRIERLGERNQARYQLAAPQSV